jgi:hypothetical protein
MQVYSTLEPINYLKNRMKKLLKKQIANANPTYGSKKSHAGDVKTGQTKLQNPRCDF